MFEHSESRPILAQSSVSSDALSETELARAASFAGPRRASTTNLEQSLQDAGSSSAGSSSPRARSSVAGALALAAYGFVMTLQPAAAGEAFGRLDAAYGGVFVAMSFVWGRFVEGVRLDTGDRIGAALCLAGVAVIMGWRRD